jgi:hypothetical protein
MGLRNNTPHFWMPDPVRHDRPSCGCFNYDTAASAEVIIILQLMPEAPHHFGSDKKISGE